MRKKLLVFLLSTISLIGFAIEDNIRPNPVDSIRHYENPEVTVFATRIATPLKKVPMKIELIQKMDIQNSGYTDLASLLKNNSSLDVIQYTGFLSNIGVRGFIPSGKYTNILIDGIPTGSAGNISTLAIDGVHQIEVLKGPFSAAYGTNAMGGIVNIVSERNTGDIKGRLSGSTGSFAQSNIAFAIGGKVSKGLSFDANLAMRKQGTDYRTGTKYALKLTPMEKAILDPDTEGILMKGSNFEIFNGRGRIGYDFSPSWTLDLNGSFFKGNEIPTGGSIWGVYGEGKKDLSRYSSSLNLKGRIQNHYLRFTPYYNVEYSNDYNNNSEVEFISSAITQHTTGMMAQDRFTIGAHDFSFGIDLGNYKKNTRSYKDKDVEGVPYEPGYSTKNYATYAQANLNFIEDRLNISAGGRLDYFIFNLAENKFMKLDAKKETFFTASPNIGLKYEVIKGLSAHSTFGMGFSVPDAYQKSGEYEGTFGKTRGNRDLKPERSRTIDLGLGYNNHQAGIYSDITYFYTSQKDFIINSSFQENGETIKTFENANRAKMSGLEAVISYDLGSIWNYDFSLRAFMNATFMFDYKLQKKSEDGKATDWETMPYVRQQNITFGIEYQSAKGLEWAFKGRFSGRRVEQNWYSYYPTVRPTLQELAKKEQPDLAALGMLLHPKSLTFDSSLFYNINSNLRAGVNILNIFDENYSDKDGYNLPGRSFLFNMIYSF